MIITRSINDMFFDHYSVCTGSLFASIAVIETATIAVSGAGLGELYADTVDRWRGLTYFVVGCIIFSSAVLML